MKNPTTQTEVNQESKSEASRIPEVHSMLEKRSQGYSDDEIDYLLFRFFYPSLHMLRHLLKREMTYGQYLFWMERAFDDAHLEYRKMHE